MSAACPFCVTWISFSLFSICPDPRTREDHRILLRPNSCLNPSVNSAAEEVPESDPNHHQFITFIFHICMFNFCWFKSGQFYEKKLQRLRGPPPALPLSPPQWPTNNHGCRCTGNLRIHHAASMWLKPMQFANQFIHHELKDQRNKYSSPIWKTTIGKKKKHEWLSWKSAIRSASQSSQIRNISAPPDEMLFRCLERRLNLISC